MRTVKEKGIFSFLLAFFILIGMLAGSCQTNIKAHAADDFRLWRQNDERWGSYAIGGSTVRSSGCYITSIAMAAVASGAKDTESFDPGVFAKTLNDLKAFNQWGGLSAWASVNKAIPEVSIATANLSFKSDTQSGKASEIKEYLDKGLYVICNVGGHWVYIDGIIGDDVYMADPAKDEILMFEAYDNKNITVFQAIKGKNPYSGFTPLKIAEKDSTASAVASSVTTASAALTTTAPKVQTTVKTTVTTTKAQTTPRLAVTTVTYKVGEYYCSDTVPVKVWADAKTQKETIASLKYGNVVKVLSVSGTLGEVNIDGRSGCVELTKLKYAGEPEKHEAGDVNNDGSFDTYDLALINEYLNSLGKLPDGISVLTSSEIAAADISGDGIVDNNDVLLYLMLICN
ncbi:dockerin type I repeat-containing protein [Ruminococcus sp.]|uniref:dockerin type I repeat-containing protein n=1 Tax=Ruminococcus sp. TaxID=41978 RepID=UPI0025E629B6|nr:dockerin type I repeat-containing protein [Ruminococcus sp.]MCR4638887.1 dockerin type I repeat-containing protein [Ruminococcus sp.]